MRNFSQLAITVSHQGKTDSEFSAPIVEMTNGFNSVQVSDFESALNMLPPGSEVQVIANGTVGNKTVHNLARIIRENCVFVALDLSAVTELSRVFDSPFEGNKNLRSMIFPKNLLSINPRAFAGCENLVSVSIPETVERIGEQAFANCTNLRTLEFKSPEGWCIKKGECITEIPDFSDNNLNPAEFIAQGKSYFNATVCKTHSVM